MSFFLFPICNSNELRSPSNVVSNGVSSGILELICVNRLLFVIILLSAASKDCFTPLNAVSILDFD